MVDVSSSAPLRAITVAKKAAHDNLEAVLKNGTDIPFRFSPTLAALIARAVVDPAEARRQLHAPREKRLPDGQVALFIEVPVYTPIIATSLINPRESEARQYPAAAAPDEPVLPPIAIKPEACLTQPCLPLLAENPGQVTAVLAKSHQSLIDRKDEGQLQDAIKANGVLEPLTLFPVEIAYRHSDAKTLAALMSADGSTRVAFCHLHAEFDPEDAIFKWPLAPDRDWRSELGNTVSVQNASGYDISEDRKVAHRSLTAPARILIGLRSERANKQPDVVSAYRHIVASIHVTPPKEWPEGGTIDEIADSVLDELLAERMITQVERDYLAGVMSPKDILAQGWSPLPDVRAAKIVKTIYPKDNQLFVEIGVRRITQKKRMGNEDRQRVAAELIMRSFRHRMSDQENNAIRSALQRTITLIYQSVDWDRTKRDPDELLDDALKELAEYGGSIGPARIALAVLGAYWLTSNKVLKRDTQKDNRAGSVILDGMLRDARGLRQLHRAVVEGRRNPNHQANIPLVRPNGDPDKDASGQSRYLSDSELRKEIVPPDKKPSDQDHPIDTSLSPEVQFTKGMERLMQRVQDVEEAIKAINEITDDGVDENDKPVGVSLVSTRGVPKAQTSAMVEKLNDAVEAIGVWNTLYQAIQMQPGVFQRTASRHPFAVAAVPQLALFPQAMEGEQS